MIYFDINGPLKIPSHEKAKYLVTYIDALSKKIFVYFMKQKFKNLNNFRIFKVLIDKKISLEVQKFYTDNSREYTSKAFKQFYD